MAGVELRKVQEDEADMRLDRWFKVHYPGLAFGQLQKLLRSGQIRVDGKRVKAETRVKAQQIVRVPPLNLSKAPVPTMRMLRDKHDHDVLSQILLYEDEKIFVFNKPAGLAVQGGSGVNRHIDGMLDAWRNKKGEKPRLVHRLDRETSGVLLVAKTRKAAQALTHAFRERTTKKIYWALVRGVPKKKEDKISTWLVKEQTKDGDRMRVCAHGEPDSSHAISHYRLIEKAGRDLSWLELEPYTGRTHQLRVHTAHIGHPIIGDAKYFYHDSNWSLMGGIQNKLHLHARFIRIPHPSGGTFEIVAPLPPHMVQSFNLLALNQDNA